MRFDRFRAIVGSMFTPDGEGGIAERYEGIDVRLASPLVLAYIGDAYFHLFVRTRLLSFEQSQVHVLSDFAAQIVSAVWQAKAYHAIEERLTERERGIFRRGRNAKSHAPRRASVAEHGLRGASWHAVFGKRYGAFGRDRRMGVSGHRAGHDGGDCR